mmetsp:Transcript_10694/g.21988  ORF Transcript_10694/g.21988 Transcript_10694/m.21988 type:complete len:94 (-) Transcript_10694:34-315(-)
MSKAIMIGFLHIPPFLFASFEGDRRRVKVVQIPAIEVEGRRVGVQGGGVGEGMKGKEGREVEGREVEGGVDILVDVLEDDLEDDLEDNLLYSV